MIYLHLLEETENLGLKFEYTVHDSHNNLDRAKKEIESILQVWEAFTREQSDDLILENNDAIYYSKEFIPNHQVFFNINIKPHLQIISHLIESYPLLSRKLEALPAKALKNFQASNKAFQFNGINLQIYERMLFYIKKLFTDIDNDIQTLQKNRLFIKELSPKIQKKNFIVEINTIEPLSFDLILKPFLKNEKLVNIFFNEVYRSFVNFFEDYKSKIYEYQLKINYLQKHTLSHEQFLKYYEALLPLKNLFNESPKLYTTLADDRLIEQEVLFESKFQNLKNFLQEKNKLSIPLINKLYQQSSFDLTPSLLENEELKINHMLYDHLLEVFPEKIELWNKFKGKMNVSKVSELNRQKYISFKMRSDESIEDYIKEERLSTKIKEKEVFLKDENKFFLCPYLEVEVIINDKQNIYI